MSLHRGTASVPGEKTHRNGLEHHEEENRTHYFCYCAGFGSSEVLRHTVEEEGPQDQGSDNLETELKRIAELQEDLDTRFKRPPRNASPGQVFRIPLLRRNRCPFLAHQEDQDESFLASLRSFAPRVEHGLDQTDVEGGPSVEMLSHPVRRRMRSRKVSGEEHVL